MTRRHILFECEGATLSGTIDMDGGTAGSKAGLLIVTGGNEVRSGAWSGQALLAARIAAAGFPVLRFDQRGKGDSDGPPGDFQTNGPDIAAALAAFRAECPALARVVAMGNCDGASALMLSGGAGCDALVLSNPWTIEDEAAAPPPEALRGHYARRLADPAALLRLLRGGVNLRALFASLLGALRPAPPPTGLAVDMASGLARFPGDVRLLVAERDRTGQAFLSAWDKNDPRIRICEGATHSFVEPDAREWLEAQVLEVLREA